MSGFHAYADPHARCAHRRYKMTCDEYDALAATRAGRCALCDRPSSRLLLDHDHALGRWAVRGIVCHRCNCEMRDIDSGHRRPELRHLEYMAAAWHVGRSEPTDFVDVKRRRDLTPAICAEK